MFGVQGSWVRQQGLPGKFLGVLGFSFGRHGAVQGFWEDGSSTLGARLLWQRRGSCGEAGEKLTGSYARGYGVKQRGKAPGAASHIKSWWEAARHLYSRVTW